MNENRPVDDERPAETAAVLGRMSDAFFAVDDEWRFTYLNDRGEEVIRAAMPETPPDEPIRGRSIWDAVPEAVDTEFYEQYHRAMETGEPVDFEAYYEPLSEWFSVIVITANSFVDGVERRRFMYSRHRYGSSRR